MNVVTDLLKKPAVAAVLGLILGLILGLVYAYQLNPIVWTDEPMSNTRLDLQKDFLRMSMDSYRVNGDEALAVQRYQQLEGNGPAILQAVKAEPGKVDQNVIAAFEQVLKKQGAYNAQAAQAGTTEQPASGGASSIVAIAAVIGGIIAVAVLAGAAFWLLRGTRRGGELTPQQQAADFTRSIEKTDYVAAGQEPPVAQYVTTYVLGDDLFDDSFSIDSPSGEFLGECGVGISETIGVGDPKRVTAFEVWMFDKNDIQTVTKVLMSAHAFRDPAIRNKLEAKGELVEIGPGRQVVLETQTLQMVATVADMQYGQPPLPDSSYCDRLTLELAIWSKK
jgi:hypothetical protein